MERNDIDGLRSRGPASSISSETASRLGSSREEELGRPFGSPAASLIQSAARSMLDETPDTAVSGVSDDESDSDSVVDGKYGSLRSVTLSTLSSLQHRTDQPAIPDEQDRKRFIGCLAAILASSYDYDERDESISPMETTTDNFSYLEYSEALSDSEESEDQESDQEKSRRSTSMPFAKSPSFDSIRTQGSSDSLGGQRQPSDRRPYRGRSVSERAKYLHRGIGGDVMVCFVNFW